MNLKRAILEAMGRDALKDAIVRFDLADGVDRRVPNAMRSRLARARRATPEALLSLLRVADVKRVCELQGMDAKAGKQVLMERLLAGNAKPRSRKPPSTPKDAHAAGREPQAANDGAPESPSKTRKRQPKPSTAGNGVTTGYETELWAVANDDIARIADTYHAWRSKSGKRRYRDAQGFCKSATLDDIRANDHVLTPGRYVGLAAQPEDDEPFQEKMTRLAAEWREQQAEARRLDGRIAKNLAALGFGPGGRE